MRICKALFSSYLASSWNVFQFLAIALILVNSRAACNNITESTSGVQSSANGANTTLATPESNARFYEVEDRNLHCYVCRSDHNSECRKSFHGNFRFRKQCTTETLNEFNEGLKNDPFKHALPKYDKLGEGRADEGNKWACYSVFTSDRLSVIRTCIRTNQFYKDQTCHPCKLDETYPSKCCFCSHSFCNDVQSRGSHSFNQYRSNSMYFLTLLLLIGLFQPSAFL